jgi:hypothetical protein
VPATSARLTRSARGGWPIALLLTLVTASPGHAGEPATAPPAITGGPIPAVAAPDPRCTSEAGDDADADALLAGRYRFPPHPAVSLRWPIDWGADPLRDRNWRFQLHSLAWLEPLVARWAASGDQRSRDRALAVARHWLAANPRRDPPSAYSWEEHATALRASVLACLAGLVPAPVWLLDGLRRHGRVLADPETPVPAGNHALNQAIALLEVGCRLGHDRWAELAATRLRRLLPESVDREGVSNEQSIGYQRYVLVRWRLAERRLAECGQAPLAEAARLDRMHRLLAFATQPDGRYLKIGDTFPERAAPIAGTIAEFAATGGASGPRPRSRVAVFSAGYLLARTGWGAARPFRDEVLLSLRFGPGRFLHGHQDGGAVTLYGYGGPLLIDPGFPDYARGTWRDWFRSRAAHDTVVVDGRVPAEQRVTRLLRSSHGAGVLDATVRVGAIPGVIHDRRVVMSLETGLVVVDDRVRSRDPLRARQLWHLPLDGDPGRAGSTVWTRRDRGNVTIRQLVAPDRVAIVSGRRLPRQGWISPRWGSVRPAPVVEVFQAGRSIRFLTLLVPTAGPHPPVVVRDLRRTADGFVFTVSVQGVTQRFRADRDGATVSRPD